MLAGQVGLRRNATHGFGRIIEWVTNSSTHHTVIAINETQCVSAEQPRVVVIDIASYPEGLVWSQFELTDEQREAICFTARHMAGKRYNTAALVLIFISSLTRVPIPRFLVDWLNNRRAVDCSQLSDLSLVAGGIDLFPQSAALVTPADFEQYFVQRGWLESVVV